MSKKLFSKADQELLSKNKYVKHVSDKAITYSDDFKRLFIDFYLTGKTPREIFKDQGFNIEILGKKRLEQCAQRWKKAYESSGIIGLTDARKESSGRPLSREMTQEEVITKQDARIKLLESQLELLKKSRYDRKVAGSKRRKSKLFELIEGALKQGFKRMTRYLCGLLDVSRSGYYNFLKTAEMRKERARRDAEAGELIKRAFRRRGYKKCSRSIKMFLENEFNVNYNRKRIRRHMRRLNLVCPYRKPNPYRRMAKATVEHRVVPDKLQRDFKKGIPGLVLLTDITYLPFGRHSEFGYLSTILDGSTGELLVYNLSNQINLSLATDTINQLKKQRRLKLHKGAFIHSDQGSHYTSPQYQKLKLLKKMRQSMSRRGNCWDNTPQESFYGHMKDHVRSRSCSTLDELKLEIDRYIHYYNNHRYQWGLKKMTPVQYAVQESPFVCCLTLF